MAEVMIYLGQRRLQGRVQRHATACERGMARPGLSPLFSLTLREFFTISPFDLMQRFAEEIDRFFEDTSLSTSVMTLWSPSIAISEKGGQIKVRAELPGLSEDDVRVELTQDRLTISGERKRQPDDRNEGAYWSERFCHSFVRTIPIPNEVQVEKVTATFENEILTVLVPVPRNGHSYQLSARVRVDLERAEALN